MTKTPTRATSGIGLPVFGKTFGKVSSLATVTGSCVDSLATAGRVVGATERNSNTPAKGGSAGAGPWPTTVLCRATIDWGSSVTMVACSI